MIFDIVFLVAQLYYGLNYKNQCRINWRIPQYLIVAGAVGLVYFGLNIIQNLLQRYIAKKITSTSAEASDFLGGCAATCGFCGICSISIILSLFLFGWSIAGCVWVFGVYNKVQYTRPTHALYCHETLYRAAFWFLIISIASYVYSCCCSGIQGRQQMIAQKSPNRRAATEP